MLETRQARRQACAETVDCEFQGAIQCAYLCDISLLGARLRGTEMPEVGTLLRLAPTFQGGERQWVCAQVCWVRPGEVAEAGIRFLESRSHLRKTWVAEFSGRNDKPERRRSIRVPAEVHVEVRWGARPKALETTTVDLSRGGAQIRLPQALRKGHTADLFLCLPWCVVAASATVTRQPTPVRNLHHSVQFHNLSHDDEEALQCFLQEELARADSAAPAGLSFLRVLNQSI